MEHGFNANSVNYLELVFGLSRAHSLLAARCVRRVRKHVHSQRSDFGAHCEEDSRNQNVADQKEDQVQDQVNHTHTLTDWTTISRSFNIILMMI